VESGSSTMRLAGDCGKGKEQVWWHRWWWSWTSSATAHLWAAGDKQKCQDWPHFGSPRKLCSLFQQIPWTFLNPKEQYSDSKMTRWLSPPCFSHRQDHSTEYGHLLPDFRLLKSQPCLVHFGTSCNIQSSTGSTVDPHCIMGHQQYILYFI
jgi:hypothetical protein